MKKILIFIENDVCYRHFLMNATFKKLCFHNEVKFVFPEENNKRIKDIKLKSKYFNADVTRLPHDEKRVKIWKSLLYINQLRWRTGKQNKVLRKQRRFTLGWKAYYLFKFLGFPIIWDIYKKAKLLFLENVRYLDLEKLISDFSPNVFIHPSTLDSLYINDLIYYGKKHNIKTIVLMNSWDNPSTKNTVFNYPDMLMVWGEQTREHAIKFMKIPKNNVKIFGAAQFDIFKNKSYQNFEQFKYTYKINNEKIILYAGSSKGTNEFKHLCLLDEAIETKKLSCCKVIYRPHPWGRGGLNGEEIFKKKWNNIIFEEKFKKYLEDVSNGFHYKYLSEYTETHNTLTNVDLVISPLSTIIIESAIHGKPSICYLPKENSAHHMNIEVDLIHFQDIFNSNIIHKANSETELIDIVNHVLLNFNKSKKKELVKFSNFFVEKFKKDYSERLNEYILAL